MTKAKGTSEQWLEEGRKSPSSILEARLASAASAQRITRVPSRRRALLSHAQRRVYLMTKLLGDKGAYNSFFGLTIRGELDAQMLERALELIVKRHEILRTVYEFEDQQPNQTVVEHVRVRLEVVRLQGDAGSRRASVGERIAALGPEVIFDLGTAPMLRVFLYPIDREEHVLLVVTHHIAFDGDSQRIFVEELSSIYGAYEAGKEPELPRLEIQYADFAEWESRTAGGSTRQRQLDYWTRKLDAVPLPALVPGRTRPANATMLGKAKLFVMPSDLVERLHAFCVAEGVTRFMALLGAFHVLLWRYSGQRDLCVGTPVSTRNRPELTPLIGMFVNTLCLREQLDTSTTFAAHLKRVKRTVLDAFDCQDTPFDEVVRAVRPAATQTHERNPLFQAMLTLQNALVRPPKAGTGAKFVPFLVENRVALFDWNVTVWEVDDSLIGEFTYNSTLLSDAAIDDASRDYISILDTMISGPERRLEEIELRNGDPFHHLPAASAVVSDSFGSTSNGSEYRHEELRPPLVANANEETPRVSRDLIAVREQLSSLWRELVECEHLSAHTSFFDVGGHSLLAIALQAKIARAFGIGVGLAQILEHHELEDMAKLIYEHITCSRSPIDYTSLQRRPESATVPLGLTQEALWFLTQFPGAETAYNVPFVIRFNGALDHGALSKAVQSVLQRHPVLRTCFIERGNRVEQQVRPLERYSLPIVDLHDLSFDDRARVVRQHEHEIANVSWDLETLLPIRLRLLRTSPAEAALLVCVHHIVFDGWSIGVFARDLLAYYDHHANGHEVRLPELPIGFHDYVLWQREAFDGGAMSSQIAYWKHVLAELPVPLALPSTKVRPPVRTFRGNTVTAHLSERQAERLELLAAASQASAFVIVAAATKVLLARITNRRDVIVGAAVAGRHHPGLENLVGYFSNLLILRDDVDMSLTFGQLIERVKHTLFDALAHQDVPFDRLVEIVNATRDVSNTPIFQVAITYETALAAATCQSGLDVSFGEMHTSNAKCDLSVNVVEDAQDLRINFNYNVDVFCEEDVQALLRSYVALLDDALANPQRCVGELALGVEQ